MSEKEVLMTHEGLKKIEEELEHLKTIRRAEVAERIKEAIAHGDISENSEYDDAKNEQAFVEGRVLTLERQLRNAKIVDVNSRNHSEVGLGSSVLLYDVDEKEEIRYTVVGSAEASPLELKISNESPVGKALMGKRVADTVEIGVPSGSTLKFVIKAID